MSGIGHFIHFVLTLLTGGFWIPVWIICALCIGSGHKKRERARQREELELLRKIANK